MTIYEEELKEIDALALRLDADASRQWETGVGVIVFSEAFLSRRSDAKKWCQRRG